MDDGEEHAAASGVAGEGGRDEGVGEHDAVAETDPDAGLQVRNHNVLNPIVPRTDILVDNADREANRASTQVRFADDSGDTLLAHMASGRMSDLQPSDIRRVLSHNVYENQRPHEPGNDSRSVSMANVEYSVRQHQSKRKKYGSLVDRGANGGIAGDDIRIIEHTGRKVDVTGIDNHQITDLSIVTAGGVVDTQHGPVIAILHQYAYTGKGKTIHSSGQIEHYENKVDDKSVIVGGTQRITTLNGYIHPLNVCSGLPYCRIRPYTDTEWDTLPHVVWTSDCDWDPTVLDHSIDDDKDWHLGVPNADHVDRPHDSNFNETGDYKHRTVVTHDIDAALEMDIDQILDDCVFTSCTKEERDTFAVFEAYVDPVEPEYDKVAPFLGWLPLEVIKKTFKATTQYVRMPASTLMKKRYKSPFPALNVYRRNEPVGSDTVFSDTPAIDSGVKAAQLFVGHDTLVTDVYPCKTDKQFVNALEDNIRDRGAMDKILTDSAQAEISNRVKDVLRSLCISSWQSEAGHQHQNPSERRIQTVKQNVNTIMNRSGAPAGAWLLCLAYVCYLLNRVAHDSLGDLTPISMLTGSTPDISALLQFVFWAKVLYPVDDSNFPSQCTERIGYF